MFPYSYRHIIAYPVSLEFVDHPYEFVDHPYRAETEKDSGGKGKEGEGGEMGEAFRFITDYYCILIAG